MLLLNILSILNLVGVHISLNSDGSNYLKDNYRSKDATNIRRYINKDDSDHVETVNKYAILYSGQKENEELVQNVKMDINSFYMDTGQINGENELNRNVKSNLKQNLNIDVNYNLVSDWNDIITNVNTDENLKVNSVENVIGLTENKILVQNTTEVNHLESDRDIEDLVILNQNESNKEIDKNIDQILTEFSDHTNAGRNMKNNLDEDITNDIDKNSTNLNEKYWTYVDTEYDSKSYEVQNTSYVISDSENSNHENSDAKNIDKELEDSGLDAVKHDFVLEERKNRPIIPKVNFTEKEDSRIYMNIEWGPLVRQVKRVDKFYERRGKRKPTAWERYFANYHDNIGIPSAEKIKAHESRNSRSRLRSSTRIVNGISADVGAFPYLVRFIR